MTTSFNKIELPTFVLGKMRPVPVSVLEDKVKKMTGGPI